MSVNVVPPELQSKIAVWRAKALDGTISLDEMREAVILLRGGRKAAQEASEASGKKAKKPARAVDDMLSELGGP